METATQHGVQPQRDHLCLGRAEAIVLAIVLVTAFHGVQLWILQTIALPRFPKLAAHVGLANLWDLLSIPLPLCLSLAAPARSGLVLGRWRPHTLHIMMVCLVVVILVVIFSPFTSQPFKNGRIGIWLISPLAQDLLIPGYIFGLFKRTFPGTIGRLRIECAVLLTSACFALWHVPNFLDMEARFVCFQLFYTFAIGMWLFRLRSWTGSIIPGLLTHMAMNFVAWKGW